MNESQANVHLPIKIVEDFAVSKTQKQNILNWAKANMYYHIRGAETPSNI